MTAFMQQPTIPISTDSDYLHGWKDGYAVLVPQSGDGGLVTAKTNPLTGRVACIFVCTQAEYDAIVTKDATTEYNIVES